MYLDGVKHPQIPTEYLLVNPCEIELVEAINLVERISKMRYVTLTTACT
jgi:hypothetical protein